MADPNVTSGRPTGDSQHHDHEKRDRSYGFESGGTVQSIPTDGNYQSGDAARGYEDDAHSGGMTVIND